ncbi:MAG: TlpA disulfide reductase family protein [Mariprofundaceae bacterium]
MLKRWLLMGAVIISVGLLAWYVLPSSQKRVAEGDTAPDYVLPNLAGQSYSLPKGSVVLLNFWATWCPPCRQEMPSMAQLHQTMGERGLHIVAISVDRDPQALTAFVREYNLPFQVLHDVESNISRTYGVFRYPESFLIDRKGIVRRHVVGAIDWMSPNVMRDIEAMLAET